MEKKSKRMRLQELMSPVGQIDTGSKHKSPRPGIALCLSGGGYRAMLFHAGALWRLNEAGFLKKIDRISSVSGGSIIAAVLGMNWSKLDFDKQGVARRFVTCVVDPIRMFAGKTIDFPSILGGILMPGTKISDELATIYSNNLFGNATLQDLPDKPRFVINSTNVQSGALWRFMKPYMADWRVGTVNAPCIPLAVAVAASSAFPPFLSPVNLKLNHSDYRKKGSKEDLHREPFTTNVVLTDAGVYDNLGVESVWKLYNTILVSDGGGKIEAEEEPWQNWAMHSYRITNIIYDQVQNLRKRQVVSSYLNGSRKGAYWGIRTDISHYELENTLPCPVKKTTALANVSTRMAKLDPDTQERLINWGYAVCDAALRRHVNHNLLRPEGFVYPKAKV